MLIASPVRYDPRNPEHREDFVRVLTTKTYSRCKNRYVLEGRYGDVLSLMMDQTVRYYVAQEFGKGTELVES